MTTQTITNPNTGELRRARTNSGWTVPEFTPISKIAGWNKALSGTLSRYVVSFEEDRFAAMTILITFQSCLGSVAAYYALVNDAFVGLYVAAVVTMAANSAFIAQAPAKWCLAIFYTSVIANALVILMNLF